MSDLPRRRQKEPWHPADIVAAVRKSGTNLRQLSIFHGLGASTLRASLRKCHPRANRIIAAAIGVGVHEIWPQWFTTAGVRKPHVSIVKGTGQSEQTGAQESSPSTPRPPISNRRKAA